MKNADLKSTVLETAVVRAFCTRPVRFVLMWLLVLPGLALVLPGCDGCSKKEPAAPAAVPKADDRMKDPAYRKALTDAVDSQRDVQKRIQAAAAKLEALGNDPAKAAERAAASNELAAATAEREQLKKKTFQTVRERILREREQNGNLKK